MTAINIPKLVLLLESVTVSKLSKKSSIKSSMASLISSTDVLAEFIESTMLSISD